MKEYKSSLARLVRFFEKSRDGWKAKSADKQKVIDRLKDGVRTKSESRDYWKAKAKNAEKRVRELEEELSRRESEDSAAGGSGTEGFRGLPLAPGVEGTVLSPPKGHAYPLFTILLAIQGIIGALLSFRGSEKIFHQFSAIFSMRTPSFSGVRSWVFRVGLYELQRHHERRSDWIFILDLSINLGSTKCLVILGIPLARLLDIERQAQEGTRDGLALRHGDVEVLDMHAGSSITGEVVKKRLKDVAQRVGTPMQVILDGGGDVTKGTRLFLDDHEGAIQTYDVTHKMALLLKKTLEADPQYQVFCQGCTQTAKQVQQTEMYFLIPPAQRTKSRWLNVDQYIEWAGKMLRYATRGDFSAIGSTFVLDLETKVLLAGRLEPETYALIYRMERREYDSEESFASALIEQIGQEEFERKGAEIFWAADAGRKRFELKFGWVEEFQEDITIYSQMVELVKAAEEQVKKEGLRQTSASDFEESIKDLALAPEVQHLKEEIVSYLSREGEKAPEGGFLLGTTDVLESIFGKLKLFSHGPFKEMGRMLLVIPLFTARMTSDFVNEALARISSSDVENWAREAFGQSTLSRRRAAFDQRAAA